MRILPSIPKKAQLHSCAFFIAIAALAGCSKQEKIQPGPDTLVMMDTEQLTRSDLNRALPGGLSDADSTRLAQAYVQGWINNRLVTKAAAEDIDMTEIDKLVDQYRRELILNEYARRMAEQNGAGAVSEDSIRAYYDANPGEFLLKRPLVRGVYLKVASDSPTLPSLRKLYRSKRDADIDRLDKSDLNGAVHYDYFRDRWVDWEQIESRVPFDFGPADAYLRAHDHLDTQADGFTYLLNITDVLHTGEPMPYEAARPLIEERLSFQGRRAYQQQLLHDLRQRQQASGALLIRCDLP